MNLLLVVSTVCCLLAVVASSPITKQQRGNVAVLKSSKISQTLLLAKRHVAKQRDDDDGDDEDDDDEDDDDEDDDDAFSFPDAPCDENDEDYGECLGVYLVLYGYSRAMFDVAESALGTKAFIEACVENEWVFCGGNLEVPTPEPSDELEEPFEPADEPTTADEKKKIGNAAKVEALKNALKGLINKNKKK